MRHLIPTLVVALVAGIAGAMIGRVLIRTPQPPENALHALLHHELDLDAAQQRRLAALDRSFAARREGIAAEMRAANAALATAIEGEHGYGPLVERSVDRSHRAMGTLQKLTLEHVFAMRAVLRPDQAARYDRAVAAQLTDTAG